MTVRLAVRPPVRKVRFTDAAPRAEPWRDLHRAADRQVGATEAVVVRTIAALRTTTGRIDLVRALERGEVGRRVPWDVFTRRMRDGLAGPLRQAMVDGGTAAARQLGEVRDVPVLVRKQDGPVGWERIRAGLYRAAEVIAGTFWFIRRTSEGWSLFPAGGDTLGTAGTLGEAQAAFEALVHTPTFGAAIRFDLTNPRAVRAAREQVAVLVREVTAETRAAVRDIIARAQRDGLGINAQRDIIARHIGLTRRQMGAVYNLRRELEDLGLPESTLQQRADAYYARLVRHRARVIARTETMSAAHLGQQELWRQATEDGVLSADTKRRWIVTPDDRLCFRCAPMAGQTVGMEEVFRSPADGTLVSTPPLHPQCRCSLSLVVPEA